MVQTINNVDYIAEFIAALEEEIQAIKKGKGGGITKVFNGRFLRRTLDHHIYIFSLDNFLTILDEAPAEIEINGTHYSAIVISTQNLEVEIGIPQDLGKSIPQAKLHTNLWYLLELLKNKLSEQNIKTDTFKLSDSIFDGALLSETIEKQNSNDSPIYTALTHPPNEAQRKAIESALNNDLSIIWGPPGTGKTYTLARIIEAHLNAGRRVLLVSHANNAVDQALKNVAKQLKSTEFYEQGKLVRLGTPREEHLREFEQEYEMVLIDRIVEKITQSLIQEKSILEKQKQDIKETQVKIINAIEIKRTYEEQQSQLNEKQNIMTKLVSEIDAIKHEITNLEKLIKNNEIRLDKAQAASPLKKFFLSINEEDIANELNKTKAKLNSKITTLYELDNSLLSAISQANQMESKLNEINKNLENLANTFGIEIRSFEHRLNDLEEKEANIETRIADKLKEIDESKKRILSEAQFVATTLTKTFSSNQFPDKPFDVLILDEASMAPLPYLYWALSKCTKYVCVVGDFLQLPPICISNSKIAQKWLGRSIFDLLKISLETVDELTSRGVLQLLNKQYRMHPEIANLPNSLFYE